MMSYIFWFSDDGLYDVIYFLKDMTNISFMVSVRGVLLSWFQQGWLGEKFTGLKLFRPEALWVYLHLVFPHFGSNFACCISVQRVTDGPGDVFPYKEVFHLSACHQQTTVESGKPLGRMPEKLICIARWTTCKFKFFNMDKCISLSRQIHFANQRNTFCNLDKYIFWFGQIQFGTDARETHLHSTRDNL